jgi:hypothetical protein
VIKNKKEGADVGGPELKLMLEVHGEDLLRAADPEFEAGDCVVKASVEG